MIFEALEHEIKRLTTELEMEKAWNEQRESDTIKIVENTLRRNSVSEPIINDVKRRIMKKHGVC